jgi:hypothetical protein
MKAMKEARSAIGAARSRTAVLVVAVFTKSAMVVSFPGCSRGDQILDKRRYGVLGRGVK